MTSDSTLEPLYVLAVFMLGSREAAFEAVCEVMNARAGDPKSWLPTLTARLITLEKAARVDRFSELNDILRTNTTIPVDLTHPLIQGDARRLHVLLWELKRNCLITTLRGLPPERRAVFVLLHLLDLSVDAVAAVLDTTPTAVRAADGRARRDLSGYLGPRCEHMDPKNTCHCSARLGNALAGGLVRPSQGGSNASLHAFKSDVHREVAALYASLPAVHLPVVQ